MNFGRIAHPFLTIMGIVAPGAWPVLVHEYEVPLLVGLLLGGGIAFVVLWFLVRPIFFPPGPSGY